MIHSPTFHTTDLNNIDTSMVRYWYIPDNGTNYTGIGTVHLPNRFYHSALRQIFHENWFLKQYAIVLE